VLSELVLAVTTLPTTRPEVCVDDKFSMANAQEDELATATPYILG
jgi:hypothetical protein